MGQVLHGSAKTTHAVQAAIRRSQASIAELAERYDPNPKTVAKWKRRHFVHDAPMGPKLILPSSSGGETSAISTLGRIRFSVCQSTWEN